MLACLARTANHRQNPLLFAKGVDGNAFSTYVRAVIYDIYLIRRYGAMPYCPKCDMEFVEGIKVCSDCGGPLVESKEAAETDPFPVEEADTELSGDDPSGKSPRTAEPVHAYVDKGQRYEDMSSSASAFFLVGGVLAIGAALCFLGILHLPMAGFQKYMFEGILVILAVGCFIVAVSSRKRAAELKIEANDEKRETQEIIDWFLKNYSAKEMDEQLLMEDPELSGEELSLRRFELIQDFLITGRDIPDQSYADFL